MLLHLALLNIDRWQLRQPRTAILAAGFMRISYYRRACGCNMYNFVYRRLTHGSSTVLTCCAIYRCLGLAGILPRLP